MRTCCSKPHLPQEQPLPALRKQGFAAGPPSRPPLPRLGGLGKVGASFLTPQLMGTNVRLSHFTGSQLLPSPPYCSRCIICRQTSVDASKLHPASAYHVNHSLQSLMDLLSMPAVCRECELDFASQSDLQLHYLNACPSAVVQVRPRRHSPAALFPPQIFPCQQPSHPQSTLDPHDLLLSCLSLLLPLFQCKYKECGLVAVRALLQPHEEACPTGRTVCASCSQWVDKVRESMYV
jgi:hypothetical protein